MASFKAIKTELIDFFKSPKEIEKWDEDFGTKLSFWFKILAFDFLFSFLITVVMSIASELGLFDAENHEVLEMMKNMTPLGFMLTAVILLPFFEELIFRLPLRYKSNLLFKIVEVLSSIFGKNVKNEVKSGFQSIYAKHFKIIFYTSALFFCTTAYNELPDFFKCSAFFSFAYSATVRIWHIRRLYSLETWILLGSLSAFCS